MVTFATWSFIVALILPPAVVAAGFVAVAATALLRPSKHPGIAPHSHAA